MKFLFIILLFTITCVNLNAQNIYDGLVGYWPMNCNANDSLGTGIDGTIIGSPSCTIGKLDQSLNFQQGEYIDFPSNRSLELVSSNGFTWSVWFKLDSLPQNSATGLFQTFVSFADDANQSDILLGLGSLTAPKDELAFIVDGPGGVANSAVNNLADLNYKPVGGWQKDVWYHAAGLRDYSNNKVELYFNGVKVDSAEYFNPQLPFTENQLIQFARFYDGETAGNNLTGNLDEIRIYERVLSEKEVLILFSARKEQLSTQNENINFGNIQCKTDSTLFINIKNEGPSEFIIENFDLVNGEAFTIQNPTTNENLLDQQPYILGLTFNPPNEGVFYDTIYVNNPFGVQPLILYLEGEKQVSIDIPQSIDFGELVSCESNSFLVAQISIANLNVDDGLIFKGIDLPNTEISSSTYSTQPVNTTENYSITFTPSSFGTFTEIGSVQFENCDLTYPVEIKANYTYLEKEYSRNINLGNKEVDILDISTINFENTGTTNIELLNLEVISNSSEFEINTSTFTPNTNLIPSSTFKFDLSFLPIGGPSSATIIVTSQSKCGISYDSIFVEANGKHRAIFDLKVKDISGKAGDTRDLILELKNPSKLDISEIDSIKFDLTYNSTVINPLFDGNFTEDDLNIYIRTFPISLKPNLENVNQEYNIGEVRLTLGNESIPEILISNLEVINGIADIKIESGIILLEDICENGEITRLFFAEDWLELGNVAPNPAREKINFDFSLIEPGNSSITLYNSSGFLSDVIVDSYFVPGKYQVEYFTNNLTPGSYFYVLRTPTQKLSKRFFIVK
ncbi:T9SS type A sorting domain-containing protein [Candidatus Kapabacteria bacterium]|nr:T9SS type A sorting domain-containing protein [Candidatus Kapabacteria bacterium]